MRLPAFLSQDRLVRARPALLGLGAGIVGMLVLMALSTVVYSGHGLWSDAPVPAQVYTDF